MDWKTLLAYISGSVDEELMLRNEYLVAENRILRDQIKGGLYLSDAERQTLAEIGKKLGTQALEEVANIVKPDTILRWHRKLATDKFDGSDQRKYPGRPRIDKELEDRVVEMARANRSWGYDRIAGALAELGYDISDQTVGNILKRRGIPTAPERKKTTTWKEFIRRHMDMLWATDFFSTEVWTMGGLVTFYVLFSIKLDTREVHIAGITAHPTEQRMMQVARNLTMEEWGVLKSAQYLIHDRDKKLCLAYNQLLDDAGVKRLLLPPRSPNLNAIAERFVRSVKEEALSRFILFGEKSLRHVLTEYLAHYHAERPHQGKDNVILLPADRTQKRTEGPIVCRERLGGLLKFYDRESASDQPA
jgi:transposase InsO family protein